MENNKQADQHWQVLVLLLKELAIQKGISQEEIAEKTGFKRENVNRIFSLKYSPTLRNFIAIAQAIGINFYFEDKEGTSELNLAFEKAMAELGRRPEKINKN